MLKEETKFQNSNIFEGMPSISAVIRSIESGASNRKIKSVYIDKEKIASKRKEIGFIKAKAASLSFAVEFVDADFISKMTVGNTHGGIVAECSEREYKCLCEEDIVPCGAYYLLDGIEDPYNFGNALRSIYASGADGVIVGQRNWLGVSGTLARASAGASELLPIFVSDTIEAINIFKQKSYTVICAGIRDSESLFETDLSLPLLVILGGEKRGISRSVLDNADKIVRIEYGTEFNGSLSASASASIFAFEILRYNKK